MSDVLRDQFGLAYDRTGYKLSAEREHILGGWRIGAWVYRPDVDNPGREIPILVTRFLPDGEADDPSRVARFIQALLDELETAHFLVEAAGRVQAGSPTSWRRYLACYEVLGVTLKAVPAAQWKSASTVRALQRLLASGTYLIGLSSRKRGSSHVLVIEEGECHDWTAGRLYRGIWRVWKVSR